MLKKVAFVLALTVLVSFALALESGPSNTVGFNKVTLPAGGWVPFGLAFEYWDVVGGVPQYGVASTKPSDVVGAQTTLGFPGVATELICKNTGEAAFRNFAGTWFGTLETNSNMLPGYGFYFHSFDATDYDVVFAGEVDTSTFAVTVTAGNSYTPMSFRDARVRGLGQINLIGSGFTGGMFVFQSDELIEKNTGTTAWYKTGVGWQGTIVGNVVTPGYYYWNHVIAGHLGYTYNYGPGAVAPPPERPDDNDVQINKISRPARRSRALR